MDGGWTTVAVVQTTFYGVQAAGVISAALIYRHQSRKIRESEKQANRARLTEAYMSWHQTILANDKNADISGKMIRRGHALVRDCYEEISGDRAREVHILCLLLNTLFLEWNYRNTYDRKERDRNPNHEFKPLNDTIDNLLTGMVINSEGRYTRMIDRLRILSPDFPDDFMNLVERRIKYIRERHAMINGSEAGSTVYGDT